MQKISECPSLDKFALLQGNKLPLKEREEILFHIADCNKCAMAYSVYTSLPSGIDDNQCPSLEVFTLLLENKLDETKKKDVLLHIADCNKCALAYSIAQEILQEESGSATEERNGACIDIEANSVNDDKKKTVWLNRRFLANAAAIVLLIGVSFFSGILYSQRVAIFSKGTPENEYIKIVQKFESSPLYWSKLNDFIGLEKSSGQFTNIPGYAISQGNVTSEYKKTEKTDNYEITTLEKYDVKVPGSIRHLTAALITRGSPNALPIQEILTSKNDFDQRLIEIVNLSNKDIDIVLSINGLDIAAMTSSDVKVYAAFLKDDRVTELIKAENWIRFNQSDYLSIAGGYFGSLPPEVWERYPVNDESLKTISWIAGLPKERKERILALSQEEATQERVKEEKNMP